MDEQQPRCVRIRRRHVKVQPATTNEKKQNNLRFVAKNLLEE
jgi:hypothetical protein